MFKSWDRYAAIVGIRMKAEESMANKSQADASADRQIANLQMQIHQELVQSYPWYRGLRFRAARRFVSLSRHYPHSTCWSWMVSASIVPRRLPFYRYKPVYIFRDKHNTGSRRYIRFFGYFTFEFVRQYDDWMVTEAKLRDSGNDEHAWRLYALKKHLSARDYDYRVNKVKVSS